MKDSFAVDSLYMVDPVTGSAVKIADWVAAQSVSLSPDGIHLAWTSYDQLAINEIQRTTPENYDCKEVPEEILLFLIWIHVRPSGASWVGSLDMAGSVSEYCSTVYRPYLYSDDGREDLNIKLVEKMMVIAFYEAVAGIAIQIPVDVHSDGRVKTMAAINLLG